ncbi:hypothetical protein ACF3NT_07980 [Naumannella halotolerans]|nr:hypothetical protein [Naumannella halotolerans]
MRWPGRELVVLRTAVTIVLSLLIGQAGWAAAFLGGDPAWYDQHRFFAPVTAIAAVLMGLCFVAYRRTAGGVLLGLAALVVVMIFAQYLIGTLGMAAPHIFLGVLTAMAGTALTSWTYRRRLPVTVPEGTGNG